MTTNTTSNLTLGNNLFNYFFDDYSPKFYKSPVNFVPVNDIIENEDEYEINISLAGFKKEDINLKVEKNKLIVNGERKKDDRKYNLRQTAFGTFKKSYDLPDFIDSDKITAKMEDGILNIVIPKHKEKLERKLIEVM